MGNCICEGGNDEGRSEFKIATTGKFRQIKVKTKKIDAGRGCIDPRQIVDAMAQVWDEITTTIGSLDEETQDDLKNWYNNLIEDEDDLGEILFGTVDQFEDRMRFIDDEPLEIYTDELL